jgi:hypothetical protein
VEPVEVNAGAWYLRALRADERVDDRPALAEGGIVDPGYVSHRAAQWESDEHYSWAVCEPTTGELLAEVGLRIEGEAAVLTGWARPGREEAMRVGADAVRRFGAHGLELQIRSELD